MTKDPTLGTQGHYPEDGSSRLELIARILKVEPAFFRAREPRFMPSQDPVRMRAFVESPEGFELISAFMQIKDEQLRGQLIEMIHRASFYKPQI